jgi:hypothetical protein
MNLILRKLFPKTMRQQYFLGHAKGRTYGVYLAVVVLDEELKHIYKDEQIPDLAVNARMRAKHTAHLIRKVRELNAK